MMRVSEVEAIDPEFRRNGARCNSAPFDAVERGEEIGDVTV
jgi:hypothetical protein